VGFSSTLVDPTRLGALLRCRLGSRRDFFMTRGNAHSWRTDWAGNLPAQRPFFRRFSPRSKFPVALCVVGVAPAVISFACRSYNDPFTSHWSFGISAPQLDPSGLNSPVRSPLMSSRCSSPFITIHHVFRWPTSPRVPSHFLQTRGHRLVFSLTIFSMLVIDLKVFLP